MDQTQTNEAMSDLEAWRQIAEIVREAVGEDSDEFRYCARQVSAYAYAE